MSATATPAAVPAAPQTTSTVTVKKEEPTNWGLVVLSVIVLFIIIFLAIQFFDPGLIGEGPSFSSAAVQPQVTVSTNITNRTVALSFTRSLIWISATGTGPTGGAQTLTVPKTGSIPGDMLQIQNNYTVQEIIVAPASGVTINTGGITDKRTIACCGGHTAVFVNTAKDTWSRLE